MANTNVNSVPSQPSPTYMTNDISARSILESERFRELDWRSKYYLCSQHDHKMFDFNGRIITGSSRASQLLSSEPASWYVPLANRRPSAPYRLAKIIVNRFTSMLFGHQRWPSIQVAGDMETQDFCEALIEASGLAAKMIQARNIGGSVGTVGISWVFKNGRPIVNVHNGKYLYVSEWDDRDELIPSVVSEVYQYPKTEFDPAKKKYVKNIYWYRRDWTKTADIGYKPVLARPGEEPVFEVDETASAEHEDGFCHFVWIQNVPTDEEDGMHDFDGIEDNCDSLDLLLSVLNRGMTLNLDPTLVLKLDPDIVRRMGVKKGSDNALIVGVDGSASYLELGGQSVGVGLQLFETMRKSALETVECVLTDPDEAAAGQQSAASIQKVYEPMLAKCDVLREQYGKAIKRLLFQMLTSARIHLQEKVKVETADGDNELVTSDGKTVIEVPYLDLPPRVEVEDNADENGVPDGTQSITMTPRAPGKGGVVSLQWGPYFQPTATDQNQLITGLTTAVGGKPIMSKQTASEVLAASFGRNPTDEWKRLSNDHAADAAQNAAMMGGDTFGGPGGKVDNPDDLPPGASPPEKPFGGKAPNPLGTPKDDDG